MLRYLLIRFDLDGWIWSFTGRARVSSKELQEYMDESKGAPLV